MAGGDLATIAQLRRARDRMDRDYAKPLDVEALARSIPMSAGHFSRQFRRLFGESPYQYLMTRRIERSMTLLRRGDLSVTEICFAVGFTIHSSFLPHTDADASLAFYRDVLGFEVRLDVGFEQMRWITVGPAGQPSTAIVLHPASVGRDLSDEEQEFLLALIAKGSYFGVKLATDDLDAVFARVEASGADIVQEPIEQDYGLRDAAFRDPAGNLIRIQQNKEQQA